MERLAGYENRRQSRPYYEFGNGSEEFFKKTGNPENGLKKPV